MTTPRRTTTPAFPRRAAGTTNRKPTFKLSPFASLHTTRRVMLGDHARALARPTFKKGRPGGKKRGARARARGGARRVLQTEKVSFWCDGRRDGGRGWKKSTAFPAAARSADKGDDLSLSLSLSSLLALWRDVNRASCSGACVLLSRRGREKRPALFFSREDGAGAPVVGCCPPLVVLVVVVVVVFFG